MTQTFTFDRSDSNKCHEERSKLNTLLSDLLLKKENVKKSFEVEVRAIKKSKSYKQLKGLYRLFGILLPHFQEWTGEHWDNEKIKELIKKRYGYTTRFKGVEVCKSLKDASMDDLIGIIKETEKFGAEMGIENCYLENQEMIELVNYYNSL